VPSEQIDLGFYYGIFATAEYVRVVRHQDSHATRW